MDFAAARVNMVESQVRPNGITDKRVLLAMSRVPREIFVSAECRKLAYMDEDVELVGPSQSKTSRFLIEPMAFARLVQLLAVEADHRVLDIGCATGYSTVVLSSLAAEVIGLEADSDLAASAAANISRLAIANAEIDEGEHAAGLPGRGPFGAIFLNGRIPEVPAGLLGQLADGGRLVAVIGESDVAKAYLYTRKGQAMSRKPAFDASIAALPGFPQPKPAFAF